MYIKDMNSAFYASRFNLDENYNDERYILKFKKTEGFETVGDVVNYLLTYMIRSNKEEFIILK